jgi:hypothetical protein
VQAGELYGLPGSIVVDNGPEFAGRVLDVWCHAEADWDIALP